eukprot:4179937-Pyramimonas_sp.AAC.1
MSTVVSKAIVLGQGGRHLIDGLACLSERLRLLRLEPSGLPEHRVPPPRQSSPPQLSSPLRLCGDAPLEDYPVPPRAGKERRERA